MSAFGGKRILVGVGGGIACYKTLELVRLLRAQGATVRPAPTRAATAFITPMMFEAIAGLPPITDVLATEQGHITHVEEAHAIDLAIVAPATANLMARLVQGFADESLLAVLMATRAPLLVAPSMESNMWLHPATQANVAVLRQRGAVIIGPESGPLASGRVGPGRLSPPDKIYEVAQSAITPKDLSGLTVLVTAGPTVEDVDPVRFLSNRSSGRMGVALAAVAARRGANVILIHGPLRVPVPPLDNIAEVAVRSARQMRDAVLASVLRVQAAIFCAAVADFAPAVMAEKKIKKDRLETLRLDLQRTPDILDEVGRLPRKPLLVGFAAETGDPAPSAREKLSRKNCDMICANDISEPGVGFEADNNRITIIKKQGEPVVLPLLPKEEAARLILNQVQQELAAK